MYLVLTEVKIKSCKSRINQEFANIQNAVLSECYFIQLLCHT